MSLGPPSAATKGPNTGLGVESETTPWGPTAASASADASDVRLAVGDPNNGVTRSDVDQDAGGGLLGAQESSSVLRKRRAPGPPHSQHEAEEAAGISDTPVKSASFSPGRTEPIDGKPSTAPSPTTKHTPHKLAAAPAASDRGTAEDAPRHPAEHFVASLDVGTTSVRCLVLDRRLRLRGACRREVQLLYPRPDMIEIEPDQLFTAVCDVINGAVKDARITADQLTTLGMSVQRSSFINWSRETGRPYHNVITWSDRRAAALVAEANSSWRMLALGLGARLLYTVTRRPRYLAASVLRFMNQQVTMRLLWCMQNIPELMRDINAGIAMFGTVETYLLYRLTAGRLHVSDVANAAVTGFYDPYLMQWSGVPYMMFGVPVASTLPEVVANTYDFGRTAPGVLDAEIPIGCVIGDQSASLFGSGCFQRGDVAVTLGTGSFMDINTGDAPHTSIRGLYPCVAWRRGSETVFMTEGSAGDTANCILWGRKVGLYTHVAETSDIATSVADTGGVRFVPAFSGLAAPVNDLRAAAGFIGITADTSAAHLTLALLQAIVFRVRQLHSSMLAEVAYPLRGVRVAGGVANNDTVCQMTADVLGVRLERGKDVETSARGAAAMAGLAAGVWTDDAEVDALRDVEKVFDPDPERGRRLREEMRDWERAIERVRRWYAEDVK